MRYLDYKDRILKADKLLRSDTTSRAKYDALRQLLRGINPTIDTTLKDLSLAWKKLDQIQDAELVSLSAEHLPEDTHKQKKRKKALLLFLKYWSQLKSEVKKIKKEIEKHQARGDQAGTSSATGLARILSHARGPLGLITLVAGIIAAGLIYLQSQSVTLQITSQNCPDIPVRNPLPFSLPGLKLPQRIPAGSTAEATFPAIPVSTHLKAGAPSSVTIFGYTQTFTLPRYISDVSVNSSSLIGSRQDITLAGRKTHSVLLSCRP